MTNLQKSLHHALTEQWPGDKPEVSVDCNFLESVKDIIEPEMEDSVLASILADELKHRLLHIVFAACELGYKQKCRELELSELNKMMK